MTAASTVTPGQPARSQKSATSPAAASSSGWRSANQTPRTSRRRSWTSQITNSGVRYTGDRHTGEANGSGLSTWASCSPVTLRIMIKTSPSLLTWGDTGAAGIAVPAAPPYSLRRRVPGRATAPAAATRYPHPCRLEGVGQPPGLVDVGRHREPRELHRDERHPRRGCGQHRLTGGRDVPHRLERSRLEHAAREHLPELHRDRTLYRHGTSRCELLGHLINQARSE